MPQGETETILRELRLLRRNFGNELKAISDKCETDEGLSKNEIENERKWLEPLLSEFVSKTNIGVNVLEESGEDNDKVIEDLKVHAEII